MVLPKLGLAVADMKPSEVVIKAYDDTKRHVEVWLNAMKFDFSYLCDVFPNGYSIYDDHFMHMFDINYVQT